MIDIKDFNLTHNEQSGEILTCEINGKVVIGYLVQDQDCPNPLEDSDGYGHIYSARRHAPREEHEKMQEALGLDRDWLPNLELVPEDEVVFTAQDILKQSANGEGNWPRKIFDEALQYCHDNYLQDEDESDLSFVLRCLDNEEDLSDYVDIEDIREQLYGLKSYGNKQAVVLDVYEHGGVMYSVSGDGMQCQFDTAKGGAVWVPDTECLSEIERRGPAYQKGNILTSRTRSQNFYIIKTFEKAGLFNGTKHPEFTIWGDAFQYLSLLPEADLTFIQSPDEGERDAAVELCKQALEQYNAWLSGDCWGYVIETFDAVTREPGDSDQGDSCWGFIGIEYANQELQGQFNYLKEEVEKQIHQ